MNDKVKDNAEGSTSKSKTENTPENNKRRDAIKKTIAAGGVTVVASTWTKPLIESIVLPAHAQTSSSLIATIIF